jgi:hypothetical protein
MLTNFELVDACDYVEVADAHIVSDFALARVDYAKPDSDSLTNTISKEQPIERSLDKRRQKRKQSQYQES